MRWCIQPGEGEMLFGAWSGCEQFEQRLQRYAGSSDEQATGADDEMLYVLAGSGHATIAGETVELRPGTAVYVAADSTWRVDAADALEILSVLVRDPLPASGTTHAVVSLDAADAGKATAGRMFRLLAPCPSATQFVGYIPVGRAPDHFHRYDEVVYVLEGTGTLHIAGEAAPLRRGTCVHLPATLVHSLENAGPGEMHVLGVFRPAGSPAEAYYPDGTRATY